MQVDTPSLHVQGLHAGYGSLPVLKDVSITVRKGSIVTLIGANGAGKSTLLKAICGLVRPTQGRVDLMGKDMTGQPPQKIVHHGLAIVPEGRRLFKDMTLRENLELGAWARSDSEGVARDFERVLKLFPELRDRLGTIASTFSGGQQQMIAIARALMGAPKVLLLDEPTIGLAPVVVQRVADLVREVSRMGVEILLIEQNAEVALSIADYGYVLENGSVTLEGDAKVLLESPDVQRAYLGI